MTTSTSPHTTSKYNGTEERALKLLGSGLGPEVVASAVGVTTSRISQLLSDPVFAEKVASLRFEALNRHNERDEKYDALEDQLLKTLKDLLPLMMRPMEVLKAISVINAAKRRGQSAPEQIHHQNQVVNLTMPVQIVQKFTTNINNQVIQVGAQSLETIQSHRLAEKSKKIKEDKVTKILEGTQNGPNSPLAIEDGTSKVYTADSN